MIGSNNMCNSNQLLIFNYGSSMGL